MFDIPFFLQSQKAVELNQSLIRQEVFAFLKIDNSIEVIETTNSSFYAFSLYVVKLYILYHDFGCKFLRCLTENAPVLQQHIDEVCKLRSLVAHGNLYNSTNVSVSETEVRKIVCDSNALYEYIRNETYSKKSFLSDDKFWKSFDARICSTVFNRVKTDNSNYNFCFNNKNRNVDRLMRELRNRINHSEYVITPNNVLETLAAVIDEIINPQPQSSTDIINSILCH